MREIVLDTETTGLDPNSGDRVIEIGCLELDNHIATGRTFHEYVHPERDIPADAARIHGITLEMLAGKPLFADIADAMLDFLGDAKLVIHNAGFDLGFACELLSAQEQSSTVGDGHCGRDSLLRYGR